MGTGVLRIIRNLDVGTVSRKKTKTLKKLKRLCFLNKETKKGRKRFRYNFAPLLNEAAADAVSGKQPNWFRSSAVRVFPSIANKKEITLEKDNFRTLLKSLPGCLANSWDKAHNSAKDSSIFLLTNLILSNTLQTSL